MYSRHLHPHFGVELHDLDVTRLGTGELDELRDLLVRHGFIVLRRQLVDDAQLAEFSRRIGTGSLEESARRISHSQDCKEVSNLTNLMDWEGQPIGFGGNGTDFWHSDQEFREAPATLASLYCVLPSQEGGETSFACSVASEIDLPRGLLERLEGQRSTRVPASTHDNVQHREISHPTLLRNPVDGRISIYISENALRFPGLSQAEGEELKQLALGAILAAGNIYSHRWRLGDLVVYDNTQLLHRREAFTGNRWIKATKIFASPSWFAVPRGEVVREFESQSVS